MIVYDLQRQTSTRLTFAPDGITTARYSDPCDLWMLTAVSATRCACVTPNVARGGQHTLKQQVDERPVCHGGRSGVDHLKFVGNWTGSERLRREAARTERAPYRRSQGASEGRVWWSGSCCSPPIVNQSDSPAAGIHRRFRSDQLAPFEREAKPHATASASGANIRPTSIYPRFPVLAVSMTV